MPDLLDKYESQTNNHPDTVYIKYQHIIARTHLRKLIFKELQSRHLVFTHFNK